MTTWNALCIERGLSSTLSDGMRVPESVRFIVSVRFIPLSRDDTILNILLIGVAMQLSSHGSLVGIFYSLVIPELWTLVQSKSSTLVLQPRTPPPSKTLSKCAPDHDHLADLCDVFLPTSPFSWIVRSPTGTMKHSIPWPHPVSLARTCPYICVAKEYS